MKIPPSAVTQQRLKPPIPRLSSNDRNSLLVLLLISLLKVSEANKESSVYNNNPHRSNLEVFFVSLIFLGVGAGVFIQCVCGSREEQGPYLLPGHIHKDRPVLDSLPSQAHKIENPFQGLPSAPTLAEINDSPKSGDDISEKSFRLSEA